MDVVNAYTPNEEQQKGLQEAASASPVYMINLVKLKEEGEIGIAALKNYIETATPILKALDAKIAFPSVKLTEVFIGSVEKLWDELFIVEYPSREAFAKASYAIATNEDVSKARATAIKEQLNIESVKI